MPRDPVELFLGYSERVLARRVPFFQPRQEDRVGQLQHMQNMRSAGFVQNAPHPTPHVHRIRRKIQNHRNTAIQQVGHMTPHDPPKLC